MKSGESEKIIRNFIEDLRRIRHYELCYKNAKVDREDREQWLFITVLRAYDEDAKQYVTLAEAII